MKQFIKIDGVGPNAAFNEEDISPLQKDAFLALSAVLSVEDVTVGPYRSLICLSTSSNRYYSKESALYIVNRLER